MSWYYNSGTVVQQLDRVLDRSSKSKSGHTRTADVLKVAVSSADSTYSYYTLYYFFDEFRRAVAKRSQHVRSQKKNYNVKHMNKESWVYMIISL